MTRKRLLYFSFGFASGGTEAFIMNMIDNLDLTRYQVGLLCVVSSEGVYDKRLEDKGVKRITLLKNPSPNYIVRYFEAYKAFESFLNSNKGHFDIIHFNLSQGEDYPFVWIAKRAGIKTRIVHSHNAGVNNAVKYVGHVFGKAVFAGSTTRYFACSELAAKWLLPKKIIKSGKYEIINNGVNTDKYAFDNKARIQKRDELAVQGKCVFLNIGRLDNQKNQGFLLESFKEILKWIPEAFLLVAGEGRLRDELEQKTIDLGLQDKVAWLGNRTDIPEIMSASDFFLLPSIFEGLPFTLVEAQTSGLPCVISDVISDQSVLTDLVVKAPLDVKQYTDTVLKEVNKIGIGKTDGREKYAQRVIDKGFDIKTTINKMEQFYGEG